MGTPCKDAWEEWNKAPASTTPRYEIFKAGWDAALKATEEYMACPWCSSRVRLDTLIECSDCGEKGCEECVRTQAEPANKYNGAGRTQYWDECVDCINKKDVYA